MYEGNNTTIAMSLPILQFEPFITEDDKKLNLGISCDEYKYI